MSHFKYHHHPSRSSTLPIMPQLWKDMLHVSPKIGWEFSRILSSPTDIGIFFPSEWHNIWLAQLLHFWCCPQTVHFEIFGRSAMALFASALVAAFCFPFVAAGPVTVIVSRHGIRRLDGSQQATAPTQIGWYVGSSVTGTLQTVPCHVRIS